MERHRFRLTFVNIIKNSWGSHFVRYRFIEPLEVIISRELRRAVDFAICDLWCEYPVCRFLSLVKWEYRPLAWGQLSPLLLDFTVVILHTSARVA